MIGNIGLLLGLALGGDSFTLTAMPGTPSVQNVIGASFEPIAALYSGES